MKNLTLALLATLLVTACGSEPSPQPPAVEPAAQTPSEPAKAPKAPKITAAAIADGVTFRFAHVVNKHHVVPARDGSRNREVLLEYALDERREMDEKVRRAFVAAGYARARPAERADSIHSVYKKAGQPDVRVWIRDGLPPGGRFSAKSADLRGTIYLVYAETPNP
jgi:hypothetical protein